MRYTDMPEDERALSFPTPFPVKAMGAANGDMANLMAQILDELSVNYDENSVRRSTSKNGKYESVTITIIAESREQLDAVYETLAAQPSVVMTL